MSLCLGRAPALHDPIPTPTADFLLDGEEAENETWRPKFATMSTWEVGVTQKARTNTQFIAYCQLCVLCSSRSWSYPLRQATYIHGA